MSDPYQTRGAMKTLLTKLSTLLATATITYSGIVEADCSTVTFGVGYRQDEITWKLKEPDLAGVHVEADQHFKDLDIFTIGVGVKGNIGCSLYYRSRFDYGWILDGRLREKDEFSISEPDDIGEGFAEQSLNITAFTFNKAKGKYTADFDIGVGYPFRVWCEQFTVTPMIGFNWDVQRIRVHHEHKPGDILTPAQAAIIGIGPFEEGGHSKFRTTWWGPWIGVDLSYTTPQCWTLYGEFEFHFNRCRRERHTDIGDGFLDHAQRTKHAYGLKAKIGASYVFCQHWYSDASLTFQDWTSNSHSTTLDWRSWAFKLDAGYLW